MMRYCLPRAAYWPIATRLVFSSRGILADRDALGLLERLGQQLVGALAALVGAEEVGPVEINAVHLFGWKKLDDVDRTGGSLFQRFQLVWREGDVLAFAEFIALDHFITLDLLAVLGADVLLLESGAVFLVEPVERDV